MMTLETMEEVHMSKVLQFLSQSNEAILSLQHEKRIMFRTMGDMEQNQYFRKRRIHLFGIHLLIFNENHEQDMETNKEETLESLLQLL